MHGSWSGFGTVRHSGLWRVPVVFAALMGLLAPAAAEAADDRPGIKDPRVWSPRDLPPTASIGGRDAAAPSAARAADNVPVWADPKVGWPAAADVDADLGAPPTTKPASAADRAVSPYAGPSAQGRVTGTPVWLTAVDTTAAAGAADRAATKPASGKVRVTVADKPTVDRANVPGLLVSVRPVDNTAKGKVTVGVDYASIRGAFGGDWATRLRMVQFPECILTTPNQPECRTETPVPSSRNDLAAAQVFADVDLAGLSTTGTAGQATPTGGAMVLAVTAGASGGAGDYRATSLQATGSWQVSGNSGSFTWSYPIAAPAAVGATAPNINLAYSSQSVDGRTVTKNTQPSWIGEGWDYNPGFIERSYRSCTQDGTPNNAESCWSDKQPMTMSLNGANTELVPAGTDTWRTSDGAPTKVEHLTLPAGASNGDNDGEYWKVTTTDGTQYYFGRHFKPDTTSSGASNATWTRPVHGNNPGEPCYNTDFASAWCQQAWRWNLDYVVDARDGLVSYAYVKETNKYGRDPSSAKPDGTATEYIRGGYLQSVTYGSKRTDTTGPTAQVLFAVTDRCTGDLRACVNGPKARPDAWPDVPTDQYCAPTYLPPGGVVTCTNHAQTFFTLQKLSKITAQVLVAGTMTTVDQWTLAHDFTDPRDETDGPDLWLKSITRTAFAGATQTAMPSVDFNGEFMANRVDGPGDHAPELRRLRMKSIISETGAQTTVSYAPVDCTITNHPTPNANTQRCFPMMWNFDELATPTEHWFHKYVVAEVSETDGTGGTLPRSTRYEYVGGAAWHRDDSELTEAKNRTWNEFRGYGEVIDRSGIAPAPVTQTSTVYLRGMDQDYKSDISRPRVWIPGTTDQPDSNEFAGFARETRTYTGNNGTVFATTVNDPWLGPIVATHVRGDKLPDQTARMVRTTKTTSTAPLAAGGTRTTSKTTTFDPVYGVATTVLDQADGLPDYCTTTAYAHNTAKNLLALPTEMVTVAGNCATPRGSANTVSHTRTLYDNKPTLGEIGDQGAPTTTQVVDAYNGTEPSHTLNTVTAYDLYGRPTAVTDPLGNTVATVYEPATGALPTKVTVKAPTMQPNVTLATVVENAGLRNLPVKTTDPNGRVTEQSYDIFGRATEVWLPGRARTDSPSLKFAYNLSKTAPSTVESRKLSIDGVNYLPTVQILNSFLQVVQTQAHDPRGGGSGRLITDVVYDSLGRAVETGGPYYNAASAPTTTRFDANDNEIPNQAGVFYDGLGRKTAETFTSKAIEQWRTTYAYAGTDKVSTTPPTGGTATTAVSDARGKTRELRQYNNPADVGSDDTAKFDRTTYAYDGREQLKTVTDPTGLIKWTYDYDLLGRQTAADDPDKGHSETHYNTLGQVDWTKDARGQVLWTTYDTLGRPTATYKDTVAPANQLTAQSYDRILKNQADGSTRYVGGAGGAAYTTEVTGFDIAYRPTGTTTTIPAAEGALAGTYTTAAEYHPLTGAQLSTTLPAAAGLPGEKILFGHDTGSNTTSMGGAADYVNWVTYDGYGRPQRAVYGDMPKQLALTTTYDDATGRALTTYLDRQTGPGDTQITGSVDVTSYTYKPSGDITSITTRRDDGPAGFTTDTQCFTYDYLRRMTEAWTDTGTTTTQPGPSVPGIGGCTNSAPAAANIGGPAAYWQSYTFDSTGNRTKLVDHNPTDTTGAGDTTTVYTSPAPGTPRPHTVTDKTVKVGTGSAVTTGYTYDQAGNTATRPTNGGSQTLTWDAEGHLASNKTTLDDGNWFNSSYLYDAAGNRLIRRDPDKTTLYLGADELTLTLASNKVTGTRYYTTPAGVTIVRTTDATGTNKLNYEANDHHGTATTTLDAATLAITRRNQKPYGEDRGTPPTPGTWPDDKGFLGKPTDTTGLTHIGAREYDPGLGRFITVDPVMDLADPQQMHGYAYAHNNPVTSSDPSGLFSYDGGYGSSDTTPKSAPPQSPDAVDRDEGPSSLYAPIKLGEHFQIPWNFSHKDQFIYAFNKRLQEVRAQVSGGDTGVMDEYTIAMQICVLQEGYCNGDERYGILTNYVSVAAEQGLIMGMPNASSLSSVKLTKEQVDLFTAMRKPLEDPKVKKFAPRDFEVLGGGCATHSFLPDTHVLMADGTTKPIGDIRPGDVVLATDPETGATSRKAVDAWISTEDDKDFVDLTVVGEGQPQKITATTNHPFWVGAPGAWVDAGDIQPGQLLRTPAGTSVQVAAVERYAAQQRTNDLTIANVHTYYVLAGTTPVLVHNMCGPGITTRTERAGDISKYTEGQKTRDPASQWYHEELSNEELLDGINNPGEGDGILVSRDGTILGGHHRWDELEKRVRDGRIDPDTRIRIDVYDPE